MYWFNGKEKVNVHGQEQEYFVYYYFYINDLTVTVMIKSYLAKDEQEFLKFYEYAKRL